MSEEKIVNDVHDMLDNLIVDCPGEFPDGPNFLNGLYSGLNGFMTNDVFDAWTLNPMSSEGFKLVLTKGTEKFIVLRNHDGGKKE